MDAQNTIIITLPSVVKDKIPLPPRTAHLDLSKISIPKKENAIQGQGQSRKRKLESLSHEEKLLRKKMKNRVAAQNSRDKKRAQMEELEILLQEVKQQNNQILKECGRLRLENAALKEENAELKKHNKCSCKTPEAVTNRGTHETGPAVSVIRDPLQKGWEPWVVTAWQALCCAWGLLLLTSSVHQATVSKKTAEPSWTPAQSFLLPHKALTAHKWWGPHQSTWNPMKISN